MRERSIKKWLFLLLGMVCLVLAYLGIILPGFPGTPFILLTAFFFVRSSDKLYAWVLKRKIFARLIKQFEQNPKVPLKLKIIILIPFWISITVAEIFLVENIYGHIAVLTISILLTIYVFWIKTINITKP